MHVPRTTAPPPSLRSTGALQQPQPADARAQRRRCPAQRHPAPTAADSIYSSRLNASSYFEFPTAAAPPQPFMFREAKKQKSLELHKMSMELEMDMEKSMGDLFADIDRL